MLNRMTCILHCVVDGVESPRCDWLEQTGFERDRTMEAEASSTRGR